MCKWESWTKWSQSGPSKRSRRQTSTLVHHRLSSAVWPLAQPRKRKGLPGLERCFGPFSRYNKTRQTNAAVWCVLGAGTNVQSQGVSRSEMGGGPFSWFRDGIIFLCPPTGEEVTCLEGLFYKVLCLSPPSEWPTA